MFDKLIALPVKVVLNDSCKNTQTLEQARKDVTNYANAHIQYTHEYRQKQPTKYNTTKRTHHLNG